MSAEREAERLLVHALGLLEAGHLFQTPVTAAGLLETANIRAERDGGAWPLYRDLLRETLSSTDVEPAELQMAFSLDSGGPA